MEQPIRNGETVNGRPAPLRRPACRNRPAPLTAVVETGSLTVAARNVAQPNGGSATANRRRFGFTLIELMIVMAIIAVLMTIALPIYTRSIQRSKESVLKNNLFTLRTVIDEYTYDKQKAPQTLQDLVSDGYLRQVPIDPITGNADSWKLIMEDASNTANQTQPGIFDVRSGADGTSLEGTPYSDW